VERSAPKLRRATSRCIRPARSASSAWSGFESVTRAGRKRSRRLAHTSGTHAPHLIFSCVRPARRDGDKRTAVLDAWFAIETLELRRDSFDTPSTVQPARHERRYVLLASQLDIERIVLQDTAVTLPACERAAVAAGSVDGACWQRSRSSSSTGSTDGQGAWCATGRTADGRGDPEDPNAIALSALDGNRRHRRRFAPRRLRSRRRARDAARADGARSACDLVRAAKAPEALAARPLHAGFALSSTRWSQLDSRLEQIPNARADATQRPRCPSPHATPRHVPPRPLTQGTPPACAAMSAQRRRKRCPRDVGPFRTRRRRLERLEMSRQRITTIGSVPPANSDATASRQAVTLVLETGGSHRCGASRHSARSRVPCT